MVFRPLPILTIAVLPIFAVLLWLGVWQAQRAGWKAGLIAEYERNVDVRPRTLTDLLCSAAAPVEGEFVDAGEVQARLSAVPGSSRPIRMFGHAGTGEAGWRLLESIPGPACASAGGRILVETGLERLQTGTLPPLPEVTEPPARYVVTPWPERAWMAADNDVAGNDWHWFDADAMTAFLGAGSLETRFYLSESRGLPDFLERTPPSRHIGYSATWFGMAAALIVMYAAFHARAGRLKFGRDAQTR